MKFVPLQLTAVVPEQPSRNVFVPEQAMAFVPPPQAKVTFVIVQQSEFVPAQDSTRAFVPEQAMVFVPEQAGAVVETSVRACPIRTSASTGTATTKGIKFFI
jgi:hypothetical protein